MELYGADARTSSAIIQRHHQLKGGMNFDLVAGLDISDQTQKTVMWQYVETHQIDMPFSCTGPEDLSTSHIKINPGGFHHSKEVSIPMTATVGRLACRQPTQSRQLHPENPHGSEYQRLGDWNYITNHNRTAWANIDQYMTNLRNP